jgi:CRP/FNR family cyclic AMP-dependent transcriptional regulator
MNLPGAETLAEFLRTGPIGATLTSGELAELMFVTEVEAVAAGTAVIREGDPADAWFILYAGQLEVVRGGRPVAQLQPGEFFGELAAFDGGARTATVRAAGAAVVLRVRIRDFDALLQADSIAAHKVVLALMRGLAARMRSHLDANALAQIELKHG